VYMRTGDPALVAMAQSKPWEFNIHKQNAVDMELAPSLEAITPAVYRDAKIIEHGSNYGAGPVVLQRKFLEEGVVKSRKECERYLAAKFRAKPGIAAWHAHVRQQILLTRQLTNSWNRTISLASMPFDDETYKFAYAWLNQSDIGMLLNLWGVKPLYRFLKEQGLAARMVTQEHDGLMVSTRPEHAWDILTFLRASLEQPLAVQGIDGVRRALSIPMEVKLSTTWCTDARIVEQYKDQGLWCHAFASPPSQDEFAAVLGQARPAV